MHIDSVFSFSDIYLFIGKNSMYFLNVYVLTKALYILTEDKYIIFWDVQMIEGRRTTFQMIEGQRTTFFARDYYF
jgi:hypothetical protein